MGMGVYRQTSLRALAPAALVLFAIAFLVIVVVSLTGGGSSSNQVERVPTAKAQKRDRKSSPSKTNPRTRANARFYTVRAGDNLSTIAAKTGVSVNTLLELNPSLDPQALVNGQRVKLPGATRKAGASGATGATGTTGPG
jgi:LysM repeat protein